MDRVDGSFGDINRARTAAANRTPYEQYLIRLLYLQSQTKNFPGRQSQKGAISQTLQQSSQAVQVHSEICDHPESATIYQSRQDHAQKPREEHTAADSAHLCQRCRRKNNSAVVPHLPSERAARSFLADREESSYSPAPL